MKHTSNLFMQYTKLSACALFGDLQVVDIAWNIWYI